MFDQGWIDHLEVGLCKYRNSFEIMFKNFLPLWIDVTVPEAREFLLEGAGRRLRIMRRCVENIFCLYPLTQNVPLDEDTCAEICINLHAFYVNIFGVFDNLAWVLIHERGLAEQIDPRDVGLFYSKTQQKLSKEFNSYLRSEIISNWFHGHLKQYRHALAHRIPLYIPPYGITPEGKKVPLPVYAGKSSDSKSMQLHSQLIADFVTVIETIQKFMDYEFPNRTIVIVKNDLSLSQTLG